MSTKNVFERIFNQTDLVELDPIDLDSQLGDEDDFLDEDVNDFSLDTMSDDSRKALLEKVLDEPTEEVKPKSKMKTKTTPKIEIPKVEIPIEVNKKEVKKEKIEESTKKEASKVETKGIIMMNQEYMDLVQQLALLLIKECQKSKVSLNGFNESQNEKIYHYILNRLGENKS